MPSGRGHSSAYAVLRYFLISADAWLCRVWRESWTTGASWCLRGTSSRDPTSTRIALAACQYPRWCRAINLLERCETLPKYFCEPACRRGSSLFTKTRSCNSSIISRERRDDLTALLKFYRDFANPLNRDFIVLCSLHAREALPKTLERLFSIMERPSKSTFGIPSTLGLTALSIYPRRGVWMRDSQGS